MEEIKSKIFDLLEKVSDKEAREILADVVAEFDLHVASNLIRENFEPFFMTKGSLGEHYYSEGNEESGHLPLNALLDEVEKIINCDKEENDIKFTSCFVRKYTVDELEEEEKINDGIEWYKRDEEQPTKGKLIGFDS